MRIARWRLVSTGAAALLLGAVAVGGVLAGSSNPTGAIPVDPVDSVPALDSLAADGALQASFLARGRPLARLAAARHLVHLEVTAVNRAGEIVEHHLDHGTVESMGSDVVVISEADGSTVTIATGDETAVWLGRARGKLADLAAGDEVVVHSRVDGGAVVAHQILRLPPPRS